MDATTCTKWPAPSHSPCLPCARPRPRPFPAMATRSSSPATVPSSYPRTTPPGSPAPRCRPCSGPSGEWSRAGLELFRLVSDARLAEEDFHGVALEVVDVASEVADHVGQLRNSAVEISQTVLGQLQLLRPNSLHEVVEVAGPGVHFLDDSVRVVELGLDCSEGAPQVFQLGCSRDRLVVGVADARIRIVDHATKPLDHAHTACRRLLRSLQLVGNRLTIRLVEHIEERIRHLDHSPNEILYPRRRELRGA